MGMLVLGIAVGLVIAIGGFFLLSRGIEADAEYQRQLRSSAAKPSTFENRTKPGPYQSPGNLLDLKPFEQR